MKEILIIHQDSSTNGRIKSRLEEEGYSVETVEDGQDGIRKAKKEHYSAILIDYHPPETNGPELCYMFKHGTKTRQSKIYLLSSENKEESCPVKMEVCSDGFISTQGSLDEIIQSIKTHIDPGKKSFSS